MDESSFTLGDVLRYGVERGDPADLRQLYDYVVRELQNERSVPNEHLVLLLKAMGRPNMLQVRLRRGAHELAQHSPGRVEGADELAKKFNMNVDDLNARLAEIKTRISGWRKVFDSEVDRKEEKAAFTSMRSHAVKLRGILDTLSFSMWGKLASAIAENEHVDDDCTEPLMHDLVTFLGTLVRGIDGVSDDHGKRERMTVDAKVKRILVEELVRVWEKQTGRDATYTTDIGSSERTGEFVDFMKSSAELIGVDPTPLPDLFRRLKPDLNPQ